MSKNLFHEARDIMSVLGYEEWEYEDSEFYAIAREASDFDAGLVALVNLANEILAEERRDSQTRSAEMFCGC